MSSHYLSLHASYDISKNHSECSEAFYRKEVENDIHTTPSKTVEERQKMMELLKRFEEDAGNDEAALMEDDSDDDADGLASQFESMDLGTSSPDPRDCRVLA